MQGLRVGTTLAMARLISPSDYGSYMLVLALPALLGSLGDFGIPTTLVQLKHASEEAIIQTAMVLGVGLYLFYSLMMLGAGTYLSYKYNDHRLIGVAAILAVSNVLLELYNIQLAVLNRRLDFHAEARQNLISSLAVSLSGIGFALSGLGVFALALQQLTGQLISNLAVLRSAPIAWPRHFSKAIAKDYFRLGTKVTLGAYAANVQANFISLLINHIAGKPTLGAWGRAVTVVQLCGHNVLSSFERVVYPLLCKAADDPQRLRSLYVRSTILLMLPSAFAAAWLIAGREAIVRLGLGPQWRDSVPPLLMISGIAIPAAALAIIGYRTAYAIGRTNLMLRVGLTDLAIFIPTLAVLSRFGILGIASAWVVSRFTSALLYNAGIWRVVNPPAGTLVYRVAVVLASAAVAGVVLRLTGHWLAAHTNWWLIAQLAISSTIALGVYIGLIMLVLPDLPGTVWKLSRSDAEPAATATVQPPPVPEEEFLAAGSPQTLAVPEQRT